MNKTLRTLLREETHLDFPIIVINIESFTILTNGFRWRFAGANDDKNELSFSKSS